MTNQEIAATSAKNSAKLDVYSLGRVVAFAPPRSANDVFINIPFDPNHEYLYLSLIAGLVASGLNPRCVVEVPSGDDRLARIFKLISACIGN